MVRPELSVRELRNRDRAETVNDMATTHTPNLDDGRDHKLHGWFTVIETGMSRRGQYSYNIENEMRPFAKLTLEGFNGKIFSVRRSGNWNHNFEPMNLQNGDRVLMTAVSNGYQLKNMRVEKIWRFGESK